MSLRLQSFHQYIDYSSTLPTLPANHQSGIRGKKCLKRNPSDCLAGHEESLSWKDHKQEVTLSKDVFSANKATMTLVQSLLTALHPITMHGAQHIWPLLCQSADYGLEFLFSVWLLPHKPGVVLMQG